MIVMAGFMPAIHVFAAADNQDAAAWLSQFPRRNTLALALNLFFIFWMRPIVTVL